MTRSTTAVGRVGILEAAEAPAPAEGADPPAPPARVRVSGVAVPYGTPVRMPDGSMATFRPGAFAGEVARWAAHPGGAALPILEKHHGEPIGTVTALRDEPDALKFDGELFARSLEDADEAMAAKVGRRIKAGVNGVSVEFDPEPGQSRAKRGGLVEHAAAKVYAIAAAYDPAFDGARVALLSASGRAPTPRRAVMAGSSYTEKLTEKLAATRAEAAAIAAVARAEERELSTDELDDIGGLNRTAANLTSTLEAERQDLARRGHEAAATERASSATERVEGYESRSIEQSKIYPGPGAYLRDLAAARRGDTAATHRIELALTDVKTGDALGVIPKPIVGDIVGGFKVRRPLVESAADVPIGPAGMSVIRPILTGGDVDVQATEKAQVTSTAMTITPLETALATYAGGVDVSWQLIERSSPAALDSIFRRLGNRYARRTEIVGAASFVTGASVAPIVTVTPLTAAKTIAAIVQAAAVIAAVDDVDQFPDTVWMSLGTWQTLAGMVDSTGRPLFPVSGSSVNSFGSMDAQGEVGSVLGLRPVVVPRFASAQLIVGVREFLERYELDGAPVRFSSIEAALLGTNVSVAGLFALKVTLATAFQKITLTP